MGYSTTTSASTSSSAGASCSTSNHGGGGYKFKSEDRSDFKNEMPLIDLDGGDFSPIVGRFNFNQQTDSSSLGKFCYRVLSTLEKKRFDFLYRALLKFCLFKVLPKFCFNFTKLCYTFLLVLFFRVFGQFFPGFLQILSKICFELLSKFCLTDIY